MEVVYLSPKSIRIKGKLVSFLVTASAEGMKVKNAVDATVVVGKETVTDFFNDQTGVLLQGAGEYEVKGTKITGFTMGAGTMFTLHVDTMSIFVGNVSAAMLAKDKLHDHDMAILFADDVLGQTTMGILNANVLMFVGEKAAENAKAFDKSYVAIGKYVVTRDKLPQEHEFAFLG